MTNAFREEFPEVDHHRCFIHLRKNIEMKMSSLGILGRDQNEFLCDIFGKSVAATSYHGIVDSNDADDFYAKLCSLEKVWNDRERGITNQEPTFYDWFVGNVSDTIITSMLKPLRQKAGLGDSLYAINDNEAENYLLKLKTEHKRVSLVTFISKSHELVKEQDALLEGAILDQGECRLTNEYSHLKISPERWRKMNPAERRAYTNKAKESGPVSQQPVKLTIIRRNGQHEVSGGSVNPFSHVFLSDHTRVTTCTGCSRRFARMADGGLSLLLHMTLLLRMASVVPGKTKQEF